MIKIDDKIKQETNKKYDEYFNPKNIEILKESIAQAKRGELISFTMAELEAMENDEMPQQAKVFLGK